MSEIVYVLTNEAMEGLVKIGRTTTSIEQRMRDLDNTSLPLPFECFYAAEVANSSVVERRLHHIFSDKRIRTNREFFRTDPNQVKSAILLAEIREITPKSDVVTDEADIQALKNVAAREERRSRLRFSELNIPAGAILHFVQDENVTCEVVADGKVLFEGDTISPTGAARILLKRLGYDRYNLNGNTYWMYEDETLSARRFRMEDERETSF